MSIRPPLAYDFGLARYTSDGTLDTTFSGNGKANTDFGGDDLGNAMAIQSNGKIVAAGYVIPSRPRMILHWRDTTPTAASTRASVVMAR